MLVRTLVLTTVVAASCAVQGRCETINYLDVAALDAVSQSVMDLVGQQKWLFTHASVGGNMISGMNALHTANPTRYKLTSSSVSFNSSANSASAPPATTVAGTVYECQRGNPGWSSKITIFQNSINTAGWNESKVDFVMDKFCYIDQAANATTYLNSMSSLEAAHPALHFIYTTMPLMTSSDSDNVLRNQFNQAVRTYCTDHNKLLFDIADIEAHDTAGTYYTFSYNGSTYEKMYSGFSSDGGHLNTAGQTQVAKGWYATAAAAAAPVPEPGAWALLAAGLAAAPLALGGCLRRATARRIGC